MRNSQIETFRIRNHGDDTLRLFAKSQDSQTLYVIRELEQGFFIGRNFDTGVGPYEAVLTVDYLLAGTTPNEMVAVTHCDLAKRDNTRRQRWELQSNTPPTIDNDRFVCGVRADFRSQLPVGSTITIDPDAPEVLPTFHRYIHNQTVASTTWIINHNLGEKPSIELINSGGQEMDAEIVHVSSNTAYAYFVIAVSGIARCI